MSKPENALAKFRSYTYYHVLAMCDCTLTADMLAKDSSLDVWNHATDLTRIQGLEDLGPFSPKCVNGKGKYIVLVNGSTDAGFVITSAKWSTATAGSARPGDQNTSITIEGSISISEPKGIAFLDQIVKCSIALGVDSSQVVFVLKTFFVGHLDDFEGTSPQDQYITDVPPLNLIVYDVTGTFTEAGGIYEMMFVAAGHGAARLPQYSKSMNGMHITAGSTLAETMQKLQDNINESYDKYYESIFEQVASVQGVDTSELLNSLRRVKYVIQVSEDYKNPRYTVTDQPAQQKNSADCSAPAQLTFPASSSIETAIDTIMKMSNEVKNDMAEGDPSNKVKYEYKIHTALISKPTGEESKDSTGSCETEGVFDYTVFYRIERFLTPKTISYDPSFQTAQQDETPQLANDPAYKQLKANTIEFSYMYTGENIDILEFDMRLNYGLAYLQAATLSNTLKSQIERAPNRQSQVSTRDINTLPIRFGGKNVQTPVFFGTQLKIPMITNTQDASSSIQTAYTLSKHASIELAEASMKIIGNDNFLRATNRTSSPTHVSETLDEISKNPSSAPIGQFQDWSRTPAFAKVKIKMPRNNDDIALFTGQSFGKDDAGQDYAKDFWFDGYYYIFSVDHEFHEGLFTQTLHMLALPKKSAFTETKTIGVEEHTPKQNTPASRDSKIDCKPAGTGAITPPVVRPGTDGQPTTKQDADTAASKKKTLSDVPGWDKASPAVKNAITAAAAKYGVDPVLMASIAHQESSLRANPPAPAGSARGLFQFVEKTWLSTVKADRLIGVDPSLPKQQQLEARLDPEKSAMAGASLMLANAKAINSKDPGDLYLAHFAGAPVAKRAIAADNAGNGAMPLKNIVLALDNGAKVWNTMKANNPSIVKENTTVAELRAFSAKAIGRTVVHTTPSPNVKRNAAQAVAAVQNCDVQAAKKDVDPCGNKADKKG